MAENFKSIFISVMLIGLFIFAIMAMASQFATDNNADISIEGDSSIRNVSRSIGKTLNDSQATAEKQREAIREETGILNVGFLILESIRGAGQIFTDMVSGVFFVFTGFAQETLGIPAIVTGTIAAIFVVIMILLFWRLVKTGT